LDGVLGEDNSDPDSDSDSEISLKNNSCSVSCELQQAKHNAEIN